MRLCQIISLLTILYLSIIYDSMQSISLPSGLNNQQRFGEVEVTTFYLGCLAQSSYVIKCDKNAILVDPRRDIDSYLDFLKGYNLLGIFLTHIHADFVAGHKEMNIRTGAPIFLGPVDKSKIGFPFNEVKEGEGLALSQKYHITFLNTPGHTMDSCVYLLEDRSTGEAKPLAAFTGDTLFVGSVGRPDLVTEKDKTPQMMAKIMYSTLYDKLLTLPDEVVVFPAHGPGSPCGRAIQGDLFSSIGVQRATNPALQFVGKESEFVEFLCTDLTTPPVYFAQAVDSNLQGGDVLADYMSQVSVLAPHQFRALVEKEDLRVIDTRHVSQFQKEHIPKSFHFYLGGEGGAKLGVTDGNFAMLLGYVISREERLAVVCEDEKEVESVQRIARIGYKVLACLKGGMGAWVEAGLPVSTSLERKRIRSEEDVKKISQEGAVFIDVRFPSEYKMNHLKLAELNIPLHLIRKDAHELPKEKKYVCYCKSGFRSSSAVSILEGMGLEVCDIFGGFAALSTYAPDLTTKGQPIPMLADIIKQLES